MPKVHVSPSIAVYFVSLMKPLPTMTKIYLVCLFLFVVVLLAFSIQT